MTVFQNNSDLQIDQMWVLKPFLAPYHMTWTEFKKLANQFSEVLATCISMRYLSFIYNEKQWSVGLQLNYKV